MTWPFENDTRTITKKLANRSIHADKRRNIFIILTIVFASCLMTVLALYTFGKSYELKTFLQGRYQAAVIDVEPEIINELEKDSNIELIGTEVLLDSFRIDDYTLNVNFRDSNNLYLYSTEFIGKLPDKYDEIAVSEAYLKHANLSAELNQEIELPLKGSKEKFTICGILKDDGANRRYQVLVSKEFLQSYYTDHIPYNATLRIAGSSSFKEEELKNLIQSCLESYGIHEEQIAYSSSYFESVDNSTRDMLGVSVISILIVIACSTVIYSLFYISVVGKVKEYGRLKVIGMTQKQIKRMVRKESYQLSLLSIPIGIIIGCIVGYVIVPNGWNWLNTFVIIVIISLLTELSVLLSIHKPIKIASNISPVEAVRISTTSTGDKLNNTKKLRRKLTPDNLAKIGFMRNHKKAILTLISLGFSGILLMSAATFLSSIDEEDMARQSFGNKEFLLTLSDEENNVPLKKNPLNDDIAEILTKFPYITKVYSITGCSADIFLPNSDEPSSFQEIIGLSNDEFSRLSNNVLTGSIDYQRFVEKRGVLIDDTSNMLKTWENYSVSLGDCIAITTADGKKIELPIVGTIDMTNTDYAGTYFFVPENILSEIYPERENFNTKFVINADVKHLSEAEDAVLKAIGDNPNIQFLSFEDALSSIKMHMTGYQLPIYGLIIFIGIFGIINLSNTLMTNLVSRQQEFGILQSIGLSNKQLYQMLKMESLYYVLGTMIITLVLGTFSGYVLCQIFNQVGIFGKLNYTFPILQILIFFIILLIIAKIYASLAIRYCQKKSFVERIKTME